MVKAATFTALISFSILCITLAYSASGITAKLSNEIDEMHRLTLEAGLTAMEVRKASIKESKYLDTWNIQIGKTFASVNDTLSAAKSSIASISSVSAASVSTLQTTQQTVASLQIPIAAASASLTAAQKAINDLDALVTDPAISQTLAHTDATMGHLEATSADVQQEVHSITHPGWARRLWGWSLDVAHVFNPL